MLQHAQLPVGPLGMDGALERPGQLLDRNLVERTPVQEGIVGAADLAVSPTPNGHQVGVALRHFPDRLVQFHPEVPLLHDDDEAVNYKKNFTKFTICNSVIFLNGPNTASFCVLFT